MAILRDSAKRPAYAASSAAWRPAAAVAGADALFGGPGLKVLFSQGLVPGPQAWRQ